MTTEGPTILSDAARALDPAFKAIERRQAAPEEAERARILSRLRGVPERVDAVRAALDPHVGMLADLDHLAGRAWQALAKELRMPKNECGDPIMNALGDAIAGLGWYWHVATPPQVGGLLARTQSAADPRVDLAELPHAVSAILADLASAEQSAAQLPQTMRSIAEGLEFLRKASAAAGIDMDATLAPAKVDRTQVDPMTLHTPAYQERAQVNFDAMGRDR